MAKPKLIERRSDFSGGINVAATGDSLDANELSSCVNARVEAFGGILRRPGSKKLYTTALAAHTTNGALNSVIGVKQWDEGQLLVIGDNGAMYYAVSPYTSWTKVEPATPFSGNPEFAAFRDNAPSAPLVLYIASDGTAYKWTGSVLTIISGTNGVPEPSTVRAFGTRIFMNDVNEHKTLYWSKIGIGDDFRTGGVSDGGATLADVLSGNEINALEVINSSLLIGTQESIARFTGTGEDILLLQDSEGVSSDIGPNNSFGAGPAMIRVQQAAFLHSERGCFIATEGGVLPIGDKITSPDQTTLQMSMTVSGFNGELKPILGHNSRRWEVWYAYVPVGGTARTNVLVYNYRRQCWAGLFTYNFGITSFGTLEDSNGVEGIIAGCDDGYVRLLDDPTATSFDDGTTDFDSEVEFAPFGIESDPFLQKSLEQVFLQVIGKHTFTLDATGDLGTTDVGSFVS